MKLLKVAAVAVLLFGLSSLVMAEGMKRDVMTHSKKMMQPPFGTKADVILQKRCGKRSLRQAF